MGNTLNLISYSNKSSELDYFTGHQEMAGTIILYIRKVKIRKDLSSFWRKERMDLDLGCTPQLHGTNPRTLRMIRIWYFSTLTPRKDSVLRKGNNVSFLVRHKNFISEKEILSLSLKIKVVVLHCQKKKYSGCLKTRTGRVYWQVGQIK